MKTEIKVLLTLAALALAAEVGLRLFGDRLSKDVQHLSALGELASELQPDGPADLLVLGNSLVRCGIDLPVLEDGLLTAEKKTSRSVALHPDGGGIVDWSQLFRRYVLNPGRHPRLVILGTGRIHLLDTAGLEVDRLGAWFVPPTERLFFMLSERLGIEQAAPFLLASHSRLFANRGRIEPLLFYTLVPGYEATVRQLNEERSARLATSAPDREAIPAASTRHLGQLLRDIEKSGALCVVVAMPTPDRYELPNAVKQELALHHVPLIDFGSQHGFPTERFPDGYHLDEIGAREFTTLLLDQIKDLSVTLGGER
jgi:hypothetical protein